MAFQNVNAMRYQAENPPLPGTATDEQIREHRLRKMRGQDYDVEPGVACDINSLVHSDSSVSYNITCLEQYITDLSTAVEILAEKLRPVMNNISKEDVKMPGPANPLDGLSHLGNAIGESAARIYSVRMRVEGLIGLVDL